MINCVRTFFVFQFILLLSYLPTIVKREGISDAKHRSLTIYISRATLSNKPGGLATLVPQY